ncbi:MAG: transcriptional regulator [Acidimicrobiales bacterium]|nr:transcriptional regulator [Acidimicrobiales bacterium]
MNISGLTSMVKIEVVVDAADAGFVENLMRAEGATGWTAVNGLSGFGHGGRREGRLLFNETGGQSMLIVVLPEDRVEGLIAGLRAFLVGHAGVMFVSETLVSRPEYFVVAPVEPPAR